MKIGDTVRDLSGGTLFEVVALPSPEMPLLTVRFKGAPDQIRCVDPARYAVVSVPRTRKQEIKGERQRKQLDHDRQQRGGLDRAR